MSGIWAPRNRIALPAGVDIEMGFQIGNLTPGGAGALTHFGMQRMLNLRSIDGEYDSMYALRTTDNLATATDISTADDATPVPFTINAFSTGADGDYLYVGSEKPFHSLRFAVSSAPNGNASVAAIDYWDGAWQAATIVDTTSSGGVTLAQTGHMYWAEPGGADTPVAADLATIASAGAGVAYRTLSLYWCRVKFSAALDAGVTIDRLNIAWANNLHAAIEIIEGNTFRDNTEGMSIALLDIVSTIQDHSHTKPAWYGVAPTLVNNGTGTIDASAAGIITPVVANLWNMSTGIINTPVMIRAISPRNAAGTLVAPEGLRVADLDIGTVTGVIKGVKVDQQTGTGHRAAHFDDDVLIGLEGILKFQGAAVDHGMTGVTETDVYGEVRVTTSGAGGLTVRGLLDVGTVALLNQAVYVTDVTGARSTSSTAPIQLQAYKKSGTSVTNPGADANLVAFQAGGSARFVFDAEGESHQDVGTAWIAYDDQQDWEMARGLSASIRPTGDPFRERYAHLVEKYRPILEGNGMVSYNEDGHHFVAMRRTLFFALDGLFQTGQRVFTDHDPRLLALEAERDELRARLDRVELALLPAA